MRRFLIIFVPAFFLVASAWGQACPPAAIAHDSTGSQYKCVSGNWVLQATPNSALPLASAAGQSPVSTAAGQLYIAQSPAVVDLRTMGIDCTGVLDSYPALVLGLTTGTAAVAPAGCQITVGTNYTTPTTSSLQMSQGAEWAPKSGVKVTVQGSTWAGNRQQIVNTANGTVSFYGSDEIPCAWYGSPQDLVHDDAPGCQAAHNANPGKFIFLSPLNPHCGINSGGGCISAGPSALFLSQFWLHNNASKFGIKGSYRKIADGGAWISVPNALGIPAVFVGSSCASCELDGVNLSGPTSNQWNDLNLTTFPVFASSTLSGFDNDGITISGAHFHGHNISAENFLRHGILLCGDNSCQDATGDQSAVDYWEMENVATVGNRGFGIFTIGGDGGGGKCFNCGGEINDYGAIGDFATGNAGSNSWYSPGDEFSARDGVLAGTTQAVTSISVAGTTCTLTATAALANGVNTVNTWVVVASSTGGTAFNGTFHIANFNNGAQTLTYPCTATGGPASGGTVGTSSSRNVWTYLGNPSNANSIYKTGATPICVGYVYATGVAPSIWYSAYDEPSGMCAGSGQTLMIQPQMSLGTILNNQAQGSIGSGNGGLSFGLPSNLSGSSASYFGANDGPMTIVFQAGITADQDVSITFNQHANQAANGTFGSENWRLGQWIGGRYFRLHSSFTTGAGSGEFFLQDSQSGSMGLSALGTGDIQFENSTFQNGGGSGHVKFFGNSNAVKVDIGPTGSIDNSNGTGGLKIKDEGSCTMAAGTCSAQSLGHTYAAAPKCFANWTGTGTLTGILQVPSTTTTVTPASTVNTDTAVINWACLGN